MSVAVGRSALSVDTGATACQLLPPSRLYSHVPCPVALVIATPTLAPSTSVAASRVPPNVTAVVDWPASIGSSVAAHRSRTGRSLTATTSAIAVSVAALNAAPRGQLGPLLTRGRGPRVVGDRRLAVEVGIRQEAQAIGRTQHSAEPSLMFPTSFRPCRRCTATCRRSRRRRSPRCRTGQVAPVRDGAGRGSS